VKLCECGCGLPAGIATRTRKDRGWIKGQPLKRLPGHGRRNGGPRWVAEDRGHETPCHIWQLYRLPSGYGLHAGKLAHREAWELERGPIPIGIWVLHRCDVPACVNVDHLFLGTPSENQYDCVDKGRRTAGRGEQHSQARLTWDAVREIRASSERPVDLARRYGVHPNTIQAVLKGRSWQEPT
jgi:hypothetical protein